MILTVLLGSGAKGFMGTPMIIFKNENHSYPIRELIDKICRVSFRYGTKGWMGRGLCAEWPTEDLIFKIIPNGRMRVLFMDN